MNARRSAWGADFNDTATEVQGNFIVAIVGRKTTTINAAERRRRFISTHETGRSAAVARSIGSVGCRRHQKLHACRERYESDHLRLASSIVLVLSWRQCVHATVFKRGVLASHRVEEAGQFHCILRYYVIMNGVSMELMIDLMSKRKECNV